MPDTQGFNGFPKECVTFFEELTKNNDKVWFEKHKTDFEDYVMEPARAFVVAMGERLREIASDVVADPRVDKSIFRIYRDVRFSKDKTPYKTHLALWFWEGDGPRVDNSGFYFQVDRFTLFLGVGIYIFSRHLLEEYRKSVVHPVHGTSLVKAIKAVSRKGYGIGERHYKRIPKEYDPEHENAELLLHSGLHAGVETPIPDEFYKTDIVGYCFGRFKDMLPLHRWLLEMTGRAK
jgi:uncharacterized protein (TIGR02453 family)